MKLDWKKISQSDGYKSLKAAYTKSVQHFAVDKKEYHKEFIAILCRAEHFTCVRLKSINEYPADIKDNTEVFITVLEQWEIKRTYDWRNFYQGQFFAKAHSNSLKPNGIKVQLKRAKNSRWYDAKTKRIRRLNLRTEHNRKNATPKHKSRWDAHFKHHKKRLRAIESVS